jgi:hypothetical protein
MKLATAIAVVTASLAMAPLPSQAFFLNEETLNYKLHIVECLGLLLSERHADECGGVVTGPFDTISSPGGVSGPAAAPAPVKEEEEEECYNGSSLVQDLQLGERVHVATSEDCYPTF